MDSVYVVTATEKQVGLPSSILALLGLRTGEMVRLTAQARQVTIAPAPRSATHGGDTTESFTVADLAFAYADSALNRLSRAVVQESPADYVVEESHDAASEAIQLGAVPFHRVRVVRNERVES